MEAGKEKWEKGKVKGQKRSMQRELLRHEKGMVEKEKKLDWERSSIMQKKGLEEPNSM